MDEDEKKSDSPESTNYSIDIDDYRFTLLCKSNLTEGFRVRIESTLIDPSKSDSSDPDSNGVFFWVYQSNSELGMWRFCTTHPNSAILYKGDPTAFDYAQTTLIHLKLQEYINNNINNLKEIPAAYTLLSEKKTKKTNIKPLRLPDNRYTCPHITSYPNIKKAIDSNRIIDIPPFIELEKTSPCGEEFTKKNIDIKSNLSEFSKELEKLYDIGEQEDIISEYSYVLENIIKIQGKIKRVLLNSKPDVQTDYKKIFLYFIEARLCEGEQRSIDSEHDKRINYVCSIPIHYMPFLLTPFDVECNFIGLYSKYIRSGAYICKLFDYSTSLYMQCTEEENKVGKCSRKYTYIGSRYKDLFPFKNFSSIDQVNHDDIKLEETTIPVAEHEETKDSKESIPLIDPHQKSLYIKHPQLSKSSKSRSRSNNNVFSNIMYSIQGGKRIKKTSKRRKGKRYTRRYNKYHLAH
jgi:hypothetical protein